MGLLGLGFKLKNVLKPKKVSETITSLKGKYNIGSADKIKSKAAKAKLDAAKFNLDRTFSKTDKSLKKLKEATEETKRYLLNLPPKKK
jgi:hypothetical protein